MITLSTIERQFAIPVAPRDNLLRLSIYLKFSGRSHAEISTAIERDIKKQLKELSSLNACQDHAQFIEETYEKLRSRLRGVDLLGSAEGLVVFADSKQLVMHFLQRLSESRVVASASFNIRPLISIPEIFSRYLIVTLHSGHAAGYLRQNKTLKKIFSYSADFAPSSAPGVLPSGAFGLGAGSQKLVPLEKLEKKADRKKKRSLETMDYALREIAQAGDVSLCVFGPKYLRSRFRKKLAEAAIRPPVYEADAEVSLEDLVKRADMKVGVSPEIAALEIREKIEDASKEGLIVSDIGQILYAAKCGAVDSLIITSSRFYWSDPEVSSATRFVAPQQTSLNDDCLLDDLSEQVLKSGGKVAELPLLKNHGYPAFAILRWNPHMKTRVAGAGLGQNFP